MIIDVLFTYTLDIISCNWMQLGCDQQVGLGQPFMLGWPFQLDIRRPHYIPGLLLAIANKLATHLTHQDIVRI